MHRCARVCHHNAVIFNRIGVPQHVHFSCLYPACEELRDEQMTRTRSQSPSEGQYRIVQSGQILGCVLSKRKLLGAILTDRRKLRHAAVCAIWRGRLFDTIGSSSSCTLRLQHSPPFPHPDSPNCDLFISSSLESEFRASSNDGIRKVIPSDSCEWVRERRVCCRRTMAAWRGVLSLPEVHQNNSLRGDTHYSHIPEFAHPYLTKAPVPVSKAERYVLEP